MLKAGDEALTRGRLSHVDQNYVRAETHAAANAILIEHQGKVPIVAAWGCGLLASVDGLRFVVPVKTINAGPSPKYYGYKRDPTWLNAVNDQVAGIGQMVVSGTPRDSLYTEALGIPIGTVRSRLHRARKQARAALGTGYQTREDA